MSGFNAVNKVFLFSLMIFAFFIPLFPKILPVLIVITTLTFIYKKLKKKNGLSPEKNIFLLIPFYLMHVVGLMYSDNISHGLLDLQIKLSLFIFPVVFAFSKFNISSVRKILAAFVVGCLISVIINISGALINFYAEYKASQAFNFSHFYYFNLSSLIHPSYLAMYFCLAISIILTWIKERYLIVNRLYLYALILIFILFVLMLSSRAGILSLAAVLLYHFIIILERRISVKRMMLPLIVILISVASYFIFVPGATSRLEINPEILLSNNNISSDTDDSSEIRVLVWKSSWDIIKNNWLTGVGTGDIKDELILVYQREKITWAEAFRLNAHNQFLQSWAAVGILGLLSLLCWVFVSVYYGIVQNFHPQAVLGIIFFINILFESMLETQAGVVFIAFFTCLFFFKKEDFNYQ